MLPRPNSPCDWRPDFFPSYSHCAIDVRAGARNIKGWPPPIENVRPQVLEFFGFSSLHFSTDFGHFWPRVKMHAAGRIHCWWRQRDLSNSSFWRSWFRGKFNKKWFEWTFDKNVQKVCFSTQLLWEKIKWNTQSKVENFGFCRCIRGLLALCPSLLNAILGKHRSKLLAVAAEWVGIQPSRLGIWDSGPTHQDLSNEYLRLSFSTTA